MVNGAIPDVALCAAYTLAAKVCAFDELSSFANCRAASLMFLFLLTQSTRATLAPGPLVSLAERANVMRFSERSSSKKPRLCKSSDLGTSILVFQPTGNLH